MTEAVACKSCGLLKEPTDFYARFRECKECAKARARQWGQDNKARKAATQLKRKYGLSLDTYNAMHEAQGGVCALCEQESSLCVDHCHTTGEVRGLLCHNCNKGIGLLRDNPTVMERAAAYVRR